MCRVKGPRLMPTACVVTLVLGGWISLGPALAAQDTPSTLRARLDSLAPVVAEARLHMEAREVEIEEARRLAAAAATSVDTIQIADFTVLTPAGQGAETRELFTEVWEEDFAHLCLLYTSPSPRDRTRSRMPSSA